MQINKFSVISFMLLAMLALAPLSAQAAADLSSTFTSSASGVDVTISNNGADALYNVSLQPVGAGVGAGVDAAAAAVNVGTIAAGGAASFQLGGVSPVGYMVLNGGGTDSAGQPVSISVVSEGK
ncbi:MAG: hypothetical protein CO017_03805 [Zetaproteobacteria bacterium CG_4_8_14_3_um_filter_59_5]|nr:MAG: hypothetical protein CO017_03805 [Zetaproteobacteria bacterium CG_4_8_14_3_um_filter_59_5]